jgi:hypothetical protein
MSLAPTIQSRGANESLPDDRTDRVTDRWRFDPYDAANTELYRRGSGSVNWRLRSGGDVPTGSDQTSVYPESQRQLEAAGYLDSA